jgi:nicotinamidase-related amidase
VQDATHALIIGTDGPRLKREMLPVPPHFDPERVGAVWRVDYEERASNAAAWARAHDLRPAADDSRRVALVLVDVQNTFCLPGFELFVPGAVDDCRRVCEFLYRNLDAVTHVVATLDTHQAAQIFHALWLVDEAGRHPAPYTLVSQEDVERGVWRFNPDAGRSLGIDADAGQRHLLEYVRTLARGGKYDLTVWPYHAMRGGIGNALVSAVEEAVFFHTVARQSQADFQVKGAIPWTEHYSVIGPEVTAGPAGESAAPNAALIEQLLGFDAVVVAGEAKSHCVAWTIDDLLEVPALAEKTYLLEDCSSPVVVPGAVDYTDEADAAFARFAGAGMHVVRSTELRL